MSMCKELIKVAKQDLKLLKIEKYYLIYVIIKTCNIVWNKSHHIEYIEPYLSKETFVHGHKKTFVQGASLKY